MVKFFIDNKEVYANEGETILQVARRHGVYIPTMCYLTKVRPISSCRLCVVEVEGVDGFILSCQTPPTEDAKVVTNSQELFKYRQNIMKLYDVNHPLECGVCDKSGECELQNKTLEFGIKEQNFSAKEIKRDISKWGKIQYDPSLCILCEKCVHTCNEVIGDDAIEISVGGYKSTITPKNSDTLDCTFCGECIAVCPVGALIQSDFKYNSNAWELKKIPATCAHCSSGCSLTYEVKHAGTKNIGKEQIYRVSNEFEFSSLCGAGRFGYDFENRVSKKDVVAFEKAMSAFEKADTIKFSSFITNEEALILQRMKEQFGYKLINNEARKYQKFINAYSSIIGKSLYSATIDDVKSSDFIIVLGSRISTDNPMVRYALNSAQKTNRAEIIYLHPIEDELLKPTITQFIKYEVGSEEGAIAILANELIDSSKLPEELKTYFKELDIGYLSAESNIGEEEIETLIKKSDRKKKFTLILGEDLINHSRAENIAKVAGLIEKYTDFNTLIVPPKTNSLGVSLICELDEEEGEYSIGYNADGDFKLSSYEECDLDMPSLNQQEGTFTSIDKRVVPTNVALPYNGYILNDISSSLGLFREYTIEYTKELPSHKGFRRVEFDNLDNYFTNEGEEVRGYSLKVLSYKVEEKLEAIENLPEFNGTVIYRCEPILQFSPFTNMTHELKGEPMLIGSEQFAKVAKISDNDLIEVEFGNQKLRRVFKSDTTLKGTVALNSTFDLSLSNDLLFSYRYQIAKIHKVVE